MSHPGIVNFQAVIFQDTKSQRLTVVDMVLCLKLQLHRMPLSHDISHYHFGSASLE